MLEREFDDLIPHILDYNYTVSNELRKKVTDHIRQHYFRGQPVSRSIKQIIKVYTVIIVHFYTAEFDNNHTNCMNVISKYYLTSPQSKVLERDDVTRLLKKIWSCITIFSWPGNVYHSDAMISARCTSTLSFCFFDRGHPVVLILTNNIYIVIFVRQLVYIHIRML